MDLKEYITDVWEELDGASRYAGLAMSHRENSSKAQMLKEMASDEIHHAENFWKMKKKMADLYPNSTIFQGHL